MALAKQVSQRKTESLVKNSALVKLKTLVPKVFLLPIGRGVTTPGSGVRSVEAIVSIYPAILSRNED
jgi:hypothetical protein